MNFQQMDFYTMISFNITLFQWGSKIHVLVREGRDYGEHSLYTFIMQPFICPSFKFLSL